MCGGQLKVEQACLANGKCGLYTFGGEKDCGYLKSKTAFPEGKVYKANLVPSKVRGGATRPHAPPGPPPHVLPGQVAAPAACRAPVLKSWAHLSTRLSPAHPLHTPTTHPSHPCQTWNVYYKEVQVPVPVPVPIPVEVIRTVK